MDEQRLTGSLRVALDREAAHHELSSDAWDGVQRRLRRTQWWRTAAAVTAAAVVAAVAIAVPRLLTHRATAPSSAASGRLVIAGHYKLTLSADLSRAVEHGAYTIGYGSVWVAGRDGLYRVVPATGRVVRIRVPGTNPTCGSGVTVGVGAVWVSHGCGVYRIDPRRNRVVATIGVSGAGDVLTVAGGRVWVWDVSGYLVRIDPASNRILPGRSPVGHVSGMTVGDGALWVAGFGDSVTEVDLATGAVLRQLTLNTGPYAAGAGAIWAIGNGQPPLSAHWVYRLSKNTGREVAATFIRYTQATQVAYWSHRIWVLTAPAADSPVSVVGIDPDTGRVGKSVDLCSKYYTRTPSHHPLCITSPATMVAAPGGLWVLGYSNYNYTARQLVHLVLRARR